MRGQYRFLVLAVALAAVMGSADLWAAQEGVYELVIKDHQFQPSELKVPANKKIKIIVDNQDPTAEEFESYELNREKVISGRSKAALFVGPLKAGSYKFFGEFNQKTAQGVLVAE